ncbi:three-helix bundle dimerization domain-containing protein [Terrabacter sp. Root181]|uniref:three-helix bundle dimerization domain-containing protein n=1 Tax=Terrabacter sp. Root181 TaxID=1736484 RepID=UPI000700FFBB|nr:hypothetical protein [Terrabacter sp. Root181]KRB45013.1 hypothetical protein ASD90_15065 [Terrabacter sp. Root181]
MDPKVEAHEIEQVRVRLGERFPQLGAEVIEAAVRLAHSELTGGIRDFVPVLVEHSARDRLAAIADRDGVSEGAQG